MAAYEIKYGKEKLKINISDEYIVNTLLPKEAAKMVDIASEVKKALKEPIGTSPVKEIVKQGDKVLIVVSDITRLWIKTSEFLVYIVNYLNSIGIRDKDISVLVALGTHRPSTDYEKELIVGSEVYRRVKVYDHDCFNDDSLSYFGKSSFGTPIYINRKVLEADRVILTGGIVFHLFAGFGGGAKSMVPGVAGLETIQHNHRLTFYEGESTGLNPAAASNKIKGNPMREDINEICRRVNPDFLFNAVLDAEGNFIEFVAGDFEKAWLRGCSTIRELYGIKIEEQSDIMIASAGGYPKDINLYQTVKTMDNCIYGSKENSSVIIASECIEGLGAQEFLEWFQYKSLEDMERALKKNFTVPGYAAYKTAYLAKFRKVFLISALDKKVVEELGFIPAASLEEALKQAYSISSSKPRITLMPFGGNTLPIL
ncbi:nickel-dependent lactate racemase [Clostridium swellfunianum]|uniref:nickel-dependent lactate racemase n=1 Tax=Clostridium swellfunianum TaxID=1367462 RepID=UPI002030ED64|nr:nickel-dependent lactate racemase [Clostridium swellfunianum]MCM0650840.1 nickel-dependent lactate racemase [Clostridium swellfunianum]